MRRRAEARGGRADYLRQEGEGRPEIGRVPHLPREQHGSRHVGFRHAQEEGCRVQRLPHRARCPKAPAGYGTTLAGLGYSPTWEYQVCGKCHLDIKARFNRRSHHPLVEGRITCSNCHQPHGSMYPSMIKTPSVNQLCYKCHAEKRGPFMWQHPPVDENCATCHTPHGSVHEWLLVEKVPNLCQGCHDSTTHPGTRYSRETLFGGRPRPSSLSAGPA